MNPFVGQLQRLNGATWENIASNQITVDALASATYRWVNNDNAAPIGVGLTATPSFSRDYDWSITKAVDRTSARLAPGTTAAFNYTVVATPSAAQDSNFALSGNITLTNPNIVAAIQAAR